MDLSPELKKKYSSERFTALEAQRMAQLIAWGPASFQASRIMLKHGIFEMLSQTKTGLTRAEICQHTGLTDYAVKCLLEASLSIGTILIAPESERYSISKVGWFLLNDASTRVNIDFNHDVNYEGWFRLEESLLSGKPEGLRHFGEWPTIYEGLSSLPEKVRKSWLRFDHFYSDSAFLQALDILFNQHHVRTLYDVGGNTGKWALKCVQYSPEARVTVLDLPQQLAMMQDNIQGQTGADRISAYPINLLASDATFPVSPDGLDAIWMSQFLDCFSMSEIIAILKRARRVMTPNTRLFIMETLWDRQRYETAALCLTMTSLYFAAMANGNSKMYHTADLEQCILEAGLQIETIHDHLGLGHSMLVVRKVE